MPPDPTQPGALDQQGPQGLAGAGSPSTHLRSAGSASPAPADPLALPAITLPKGGRAIRGIDEKLTAGPATGTAPLSVPFPASPGRQGPAPSLPLAYDSGAGNGPFGLGWPTSLFGQDARSRIADPADPPGPAQSGDRVTGCATWSPARWRAPGGAGAQEDSHSLLAALTALAHLSNWADTTRERDKSAKAGQMPRADTSADKRPLLRWPPRGRPIAPGTTYGHLGREGPCLSERRRWLLARPGRGQGCRQPPGGTCRRWPAALGSKVVRHGG